jgi:Xaa-Pro aminopeptidase
MNDEHTAAYRARRRTVMDRLQGSALVLPAAPQPRAGGDTELRYVPDADLFYLTGYTEQEAVAVLCPGHEAPFTLFVRPRDPAAERWTGVRGGVEAATRLGADAAYPIAELESRLAAITRDADRILLRFGTGRDDVEAMVQRLLERARDRRRRHGRGPHIRADAGIVLDGMRLVKDDVELERMRDAARVTTDGFREALGRVSPGMGEWEVEAAIDAAFRRRQADGPSFPTIAAAGANATVLHYTDNARVMEPGTLLLLDAGARVRGYCGDVTRTVPVDGKFRPEQRAVYDAVLAAHHAGIDAVRPGASLADVHGAAVRVLAEAMVQLGLLQGPTDALLARYQEEETARREGREPAAEDDQEPGISTFFPHRTSHWLGLEVHDVGAQVVDDTPLPLQPGMILTVEPGLYVPADSDAPEALRGVGVRIEDDVLVTAAGHDVLTADLPADADAVADLLAGSR